jgi:hypothetical protein
LPQPLLNQLLGRGLLAVLDEITRNCPSVTIHAKPYPDATVKVEPRNGFVVALLQCEHFTVVSSVPAWRA